MAEERKCYWCKKEAQKFDYRCIDGMVSKITSCNKCSWIPTEELIQKFKTKENAK